MEVEGYLTDEGQIEEVKEPLRDTLAKDRPAIVLLAAAPGINSRGRIRFSCHVQVKEASTISVVVQTKGPHEL